MEEEIDRKLYGSAFLYFMDNTLREEWENLSSTCAEVSYKISVIKLANFVQDMHIRLESLEEKDRCQKK